MRQLGFRLLLCPAQRRMIPFRRLGILLCPARRRNPVLRGSTNAGRSNVRLSVRTGLEWQNQSICGEWHLYTEQPYAYDAVVFCVSSDCTVNEQGQLVARVQRPTSADNGNSLGQGIRVVFDNARATCP